MKLLLDEDEIPDREVAFEDEPETIGGIMEVKIKYMHDLIYFDYETFDSDEFRCCVEPYLTGCEITERIKSVPKTEHNYKQMLARCYNFDCTFELTI